MLLTITATCQPATDLGYLLHKNPARLHTKELSFGRAHVFFPEASSSRCTAALMLEVDPVLLSRGRGKAGKDGAALQPYVNDRPYAASSFLSVAMARLFGTAMSGRSKERPQLASQALDFEVSLHTLPSRGGEVVLRRVFEPLGFTVKADPISLDPRLPDWGPSRYLNVKLYCKKRLGDILTQLYVLIPVMDDDKHYWVSRDEVDKLLGKGEGWLPAHPEKKLIAQRYLKHQQSLARDALARLVPEEALEEQPEAVEEEIERPISLHEERLGAVVTILKKHEVRSVVDLGCGEGRLLRSLLAEASFERILGMDVSMQALERASARIKLGRLPARQKDRIELIHGALTYRDRRIEGCDAAAVVEVIEHLDPPRLAAFERVLFGCVKPKLVVLTTPNIEFNAEFESLPAGRLRHPDHRFEWTRQQFAAWTEHVCSDFAYTVERHPVGRAHDVHGSPTQMAVFSRAEGQAS